MKRWALYLFGLSAIVGLGWFGIAWMQHHSSAQDAPLPDLTKAPVNAEAAGWADNQMRTQKNDDRGIPGTVAGAANADRPPADPFQGISQTAATLSTPSVSTSSGSETANASGASRQIVGDRYANDNRNGGNNRYAAAEPQPLNSDPAAQPLAPEPSSNHSSAETSAPNEYRNTPVDYRNQAPGNAWDQTPAVAGPSSATATQPDEAHSANSEAQTTKTSARSYEEGAAQQPTAIVGAAGNEEPSMEERLNPSRTAAAANTPKANTTQERSSFNSQPGGLGSTSNSGGLRQPNSLGTPNVFATNSPINDNAVPLAARNNATIPNTGITNAGFTVPSAGAPVAAGQEGFGKPGDKKLDGAQTPSVTIEKIAPPEIQVGKPAKFQIVIRNTGPVVANDVEVTDPVPQGTQLLTTNPRTTTGPRGEILWKAGDLRPGEDSKLEVELMPIAEGEIGSTATVQFRSVASMRTVATKPELVLEINSPKNVLIGQNITLHVKLSNPGTGAASNVVLSAKLPPNLQHQAGSELEFDVGQFKPGDSREMELSLHAAQAGPCAVAISAQADASLHAEQTANIEVVAPRLEVKLTGPGLRYLEKQAKYTVSVSNPGTAPARDITLVTRLPQGMKFVDASDSGHYDSASNAVMWGLDELPAGQSGSVTLTTLAKDIGDQKVRSEIKAAGGLSDANEQVTVVEGVAAVEFTVTSVDDPVEVGNKATYEIHVVNQGSKAANHLQIMAVMPEGMQPVSGEGPSKQVLDGQRVIFEPLPRLEPKRDFTYKVVGQCSAPGDMRIQVYLQSDEMSKPVIKEEGTKVYKD